MTKRYTGKPSVLRRGTVINYAQHRDTVYYVIELSCGHIVERRTKSEFTRCEKCGEIEKAEADNG